MVEVEGRWLWRRGSGGTEVSVDEVVVAVEVGGASGGAVEGGLWLWRVAVFEPLFATSKVEQSHIC